MMRYGKSLHTIDVDCEGINIMDSTNIYISGEFKEAVRRGKFIIPDEPSEINKKTNLSYDILGSLKKLFYGHV